MIQLRRERSSDAIRAEFRGRTRVKRLVKLVEDFLDGKVDGPDSYFTSNSKWKNAKEQLLKESHDKCAYCEAPTSLVAFGDVEHYRPKSVYWWLAYCYDNYAASCQLCNQAFKVADFPRSGPAIASPSITVQDWENSTDAGFADLCRRINPDPFNEDEGMPWADFQQQCEDEQPGIPDPYLTDPETLFAWFADPVLKEIEVRPADGSAESIAAYEAADEFLGLNREELKKGRWYMAYEPIHDSKVQLDAAAAGSIAEQNALDALTRRMQPDRPFSGMARYFIRSKWRLPL